MLHEKQKESSSGQQKDSPKNGLSLKPPRTKSFTKDNMPTPKFKRIMSKMEIPNSSPYSSNEIPIDYDSSKNLSKTSNMNSSSSKKNSSGQLKSSEPHMLYSSPSVEAQQMNTNGTGEFPYISKEISSIAKNSKSRNPSFFFSIKSVSSNASYKKNTNNLSKSGSMSIQSSMFVNQSEDLSNSAITRVFDLNKVENAIDIQPFMELYETTKIFARREAHK